MALTYGSNTYAGQKAEGFIADMLLNGDTLGAGHFTIHPGVKGKKVIQTISTNATFQSRADSFTASGATSIGERLLTLANIMTQDEVGINVLLSAWQSAQMADSANDKDLPTDLSNFLIEEKARLIRNQIDELIWRGDTTLTSNTIRKWHNGILTLAEADSGVSKYATTTGQATVNAITVGATTALTTTAAHNLNVGDKVYCKNFAGADAATLNTLTFTVQTVPTTTTLTIDAVTTGLTITDNTDAAILQFVNKSNVLTYFESIFSLSREQDRTAPDFKLFVPVHVADAYVGKSLDVASGQGYNYEKDGNLVYRGIPVVKCKFFPENTIFASTTSNLHFGTDLLDDQNEVVAKYMKDVTLDDVYRFSAKFSSSVNYGFANQIKMYRPA